MKKIAIALTCLMLATILLTCALAVNIEFRTTAPRAYRVFMTSESDNYAVFQIVYYAEDSHELTGIQVITRFSRDSGVRLSDISGLSDSEMDEYYPGYSDMIFASKETYEVDGYVDMAVTFAHLDWPANKEKLNQYGMLTLSDPFAPVSADDYISYLLNSVDVEEVPQVNYGDLGFHF